MNMTKFRVFCCLAFTFLFSTFLHAQDPQVKSEKSDEYLERGTKLSELILSETANLKLAENRAFVFAHVGSGLCKTDSKRALQLFKSSINDLVLAQQEAENFKKTTSSSDQLIFGQTPRRMILDLIGECDPEYALEALLKSRPSRLSQMILNKGSKSTMSSNSQYYLIAETQYEQRFIGLAAEKNPERAIALLRESLKNGASFETIPLLQKIFAKDPKAAQEIAEEIAQNLAREILSSGNDQSSSMVQYFLEFFADSKTSEEKSLEISDASLKGLADKYSAYWLEGENYDFDTDSASFKIIEKYFPARSAKIKAKKSTYADIEYEQYSKLVEGNVPVEELLKQAEKLPNYRQQIYTHAAQKMGESGNVAGAIDILNSKFSEEDAAQQVGNFYYMLANLQISKENFENANSSINQIPMEQLRFSALIQLALSVYQKNTKENKQWAMAILNEASGLTDTSEINQQELSNLLELASGYSSIEPAQAFRTIESVVPSINEYSRAYAVVSQFRNEQMMRNGECLISMNSNFTAAYSLGGLLQILKDNDFARTMQLIDRFDRSETRIALKLEIFKNLMQQTLEPTNISTK
jgi:hypothetical protein